MALLVGIDVETTGLSAEEDRILEVGAVLLDWQTGTPLQLLSKLVRPDRPIPPEITKINGIDDEMVDCYGEPEAKVFAELNAMMASADYAMAHNAEFDKGFYLATNKRLGNEDNGIFWLCSKNDIRYPESITTRNLRHLAAEHNFCNPLAHRAVFDVLTMFKIAQSYSLDDIIARAKEPTLVVQAIVSFDDKELAKARGYYWCAPKKIWWRTFKQSDFLAERDTCGFRTQLLEKAPE